MLGARLAPNRARKQPACHHLDPQRQKARQSWENRKCYSRDRQLRSKIEVVCILFAADAPIPRKRPALGSDSAAEIRSSGSWSQGVPDATAESLPQKTKVKRVSEPAVAESVPRKTVQEVARSTAATSRPTGTVQEVAESAAATPRSKMRVQEVAGSAAATLPPKRPVQEVAKSAAATSRPKKTARDIAKSGTAKSVVVLHPKAPPKKGPGWRVASPTRVPAATSKVRVFDAWSSKGEGFWRGDFSRLPHQRWQRVFLWP